MTELTSPRSKQQRKPLVFWRKKQHKTNHPPTTLVVDQDAVPCLIPAFEHPCSPRGSQHSSSTLSTLHESDASFLTFQADDEEDHHRHHNSRSWTVTMRSPCRSPLTPPPPLRHRTVTRSHHHHPALASIPPPSVVVEQSRMQEPPTTSSSSTLSEINHHQDSSSSKHVAEELQEQELLEYAMKLSLREVPVQRSSSMLPTAPSLLLEEEDRLEERKRFERVLLASRTDL